MAFPTKPSDKPRWTVLDDAADTVNDVTDPTSLQSNVDTPSEAKQDTGFLFKEFPPRQDFNWLFRKIYQWLRWSEDSIDELKLQIPDGYKHGLTLRNDVTDSDHDLVILPGVAVDSANEAGIRLSSSLTKKIDASWTQGNNQGGMPSGVLLSSDTWYHVFVILDTASGIVDAGFDTSITAANLLVDSGYDKYRRVGSVLTNGSINIIQFYQTNNFFRWASPQLAYSNDFGTSGSVNLQNINLSFVPPQVETTCSICHVRGEAPTAGQWFGIDDRRVVSNVSTGPFSDVGFYTDRSSTNTKRNTGNSITTFGGEAQLDTEGSANGWGFIELFTNGYREVF